MHEIEALAELVPTYPIRRCHPLTHQLPPFTRQTAAVHVSDASR